MAVSYRLAVRQLVPRQITHIVHLVNRMGYIRAVPGASEVAESSVIHGIILIRVMITVLASDVITMIDSKDDHLVEILKLIGRKTKTDTSAEAPDTMIEEESLMRTKRKNPNGKTSHKHENSN